jgi:hypothetical protein
MRFSRPLHNCRPVVPYARNRRPHIPPPGQVLIVSAAGCITCQYGKPTLNGESSIASRCIRSCLAAHGPEGERSTQTVVLTQSRDSCMLQLLPRIFNALLYCFLCPPSKRIMPFVPHIPTMFDVHYTRWALGPVLFDSSVTPSGPPSRHAVVLVASWPLSLSMPQSWVLCPTAPCSRHTRPSMYRHNLHRAGVIVCLIDHAAARSKFQTLC